MSRADRPVKIPARKAAIKLVAGHVAGIVGAGSMEEATGLFDSDYERLTPAEARRLDWAVAEVIRRLYAMGGRS